MCVCFRPPARLVCPNHEVVEFQPRKVTDPDLGSDANAYTIYIPPTPPVQLCSRPSPPPPPWAYILSSPTYFPRWHCFYLDFHHLLPPPSFPVADQPSTKLNRYAKPLFFQWKNIKINDINQKISSYLYICLFIIFIYYYYYDLIQFYLGI